MLLLRPFITFGFLMALSGCSWMNPFSEEEKETRVKPIEGLELTLNRGSLNGTEFEHFRYQGKSLFVECGVIDRGRFLPTFQTVRPFDPNKIQTISKAVIRLKEILNDETWAWAKPGNGRSLTDPGQLKLSLDDRKSIKIDTSLDSISDPKNRAQRELRVVAKTVRTLAGVPICGNAEFYGMGYLR